MILNFIDTNITYIATIIAPILSCPVIVWFYKKLTTPAPVKINRRLRILNKHCDEYFQIKDQDRSPEDEKYIAYKKKDTIMRCITGVVNKEEREIFTKVDMQCNGKINLFNFSKILKYLTVCDNETSLKFEIKKFEKDRIISALAAGLSGFAMALMITLGICLTYKEVSFYGIALCYFYAIVFELVAIFYFSKCLLKSNYDKIFDVIKKEKIYEDVKYI